MAAGDLLVGAIDFGTTNSGWACSFLHEFQTDPTKSFVKQWHSESGTLVTEKAPTCLLIKPDGKTLEAFGYDAENKYRELTDEGDHESYYYFRRFKMMLNKKLGDKLDRQMTIEDEMGKPLIALNVFSMAIKYLVDDMMKHVKDRLTSALDITDVHWVLTVPAIWIDAAKQFMREAAIEAGLSTKKLTIALEPEAASIFCRHLSVDTTICGGTKSVAKMVTGTKYMVLDAGGGTIDITVHEVVSQSSVKEVLAASGGGWGGILVDKAFEDLLVDIVGVKAYETFKRTDAEDWIDLWRDFEVKKRTVTPEKNARVILKFPLSFITTFKQVTQREMSDAIEDSKYAADIEFRKDKMKFSAILFKSLFEHAIQKTIGHMKALLRSEQVRQIKAILMVGGYSESPMLQHAIKEEFVGIDVVIPHGASSTILRGALIYGHSPISIQERVLKYTYGVRTTQEFREGIDPEHLKVTKATGVRCSRIFSKHVRKGQVVKCNEPQMQKVYTTNKKFQDKVTLKLYISEETNVRYTDDCTRIGEFSILLEEPEEKPGREVVVSMTFSGTEIMVKAVDGKTGSETSVYTNFLG